MMRRKNDKYMLWLLLFGMALNCFLSYQAIRAMATFDQFVSDVRKYTQMKSESEGYIR